jgi:hypothetical protein
MNAEARMPEAAPLAYQAEVLRGQVQDDNSRRFWRARQRLLRAFDNRKEEIERDYQRLSDADFLAKYEGWRFL